MPAIIAWVIGGLLSVAGQFVIKALLTLGLTYVVDKFSVSAINSYLHSQANAIPAQMADVLGFLGVFQAVTLIVSAIGVNAAINAGTAVLKTKVR